MQSFKSNRFVSGYSVASCLKLVAANLLLILLWKETRIWLWCGWLWSLFSLYWSDFWCVYAHARNKNESPQWGSCRVYSIGNRVLCVCRGERGRDRESGCEGQALPCTVGHSLTFHCFHFSITPFFPFPCFNVSLHFCLLSGGVWFHHGQLGLRSSHNDWRIVHLQPQGGGSHLPGLPRWHWVCFTLWQY